MMGRLDRPTRVTKWAIAVAVLLALGTATYLGLMYSVLPRGLPVQYVRGQPFIFTLKSPLVVMLPALMQLGLLAVFGSVIVLLLWRSAHALERAHESEADDSRMRLAAEGIALLAAIWIGVQTLGAVRLIVLWRGAWGGFGPLYSAATVLALLVSVVVMVRTMRLVGRQRRHDAPDNPALWRLRHLYFNPKNPSLFVQTRTGTGWTLNFGRPIAIVLLGGILLVGVGGPYAIARYVLHGRLF